MSRIIVKDLPKSIAESRIKDIFSEKGIVTDVQLKYTKDGQFRRFCFIGYKTNEEAQAAIDYFNKTCIDTCKITVQLCAQLGDSSKPKSWSKYAADSNVKSKILNTIANNKTELNEKEWDKTKNNDKLNIKEILNEHKDDTLFKEFLENHAAKVKLPWSNDNTLSESNAIEEKKIYELNNRDDAIQTEDINVKKEKMAEKNISDFEYMEALKKKVPVEEEKPQCKKHGSVKFFTVKLRGLAYNHKKKHIKLFFSPLKAKSIRVPPKIKGIAYVGFKTERHMKQALLKNKSFLEGKRIFVTKYDEKEKGNQSSEEHNVKWKKQEESLQNEESVAESGRIFLRNLAYTVTEDEIRTLFEKYGPLTEVNLPVDKDTRKMKGFGTVTFLMPEHAVKAFSELDGTVLEGRMLHLMPGKSKATITDLLQQDGLTFKQKKELINKSTANSSHNWNTLFFGQNAVVEALAATYDVTKEKFLEDNGSNTSVAVRLALGETQLVEETQKFLESHGVHLEAFNQPAKQRSKTVILVKNLPAGTKEEEIHELFAKHGELARVVLPPSGITALVEFIEPSEARKAFTKFAYTKFKSLPLYLEWAPENSFVHSTRQITEANSHTDKNKVSKCNELTNDKKQKVEEKVTGNEESSDEDDEPEEETTLFVKNLNFSTTEEMLKEYFEKCGKLHYVNIAMKKDPKNIGEKLSMGYGFVRYKLKVDADRALKELQMTTLDGKSLDLKRSERTLQSDVKSTRKITKVMQQTGTKILVRNIPFQATVEEVAELFKTFGELKGVRLPKKLVGVEKHKGFGFVEYCTKKEAKRAFKALGQSTHLYGRRLVLEWAQTEEGIEEIRKRTAKHFHEDETVSKQPKKSILEAESIGLEAE